MIRQLLCAQLLGVCLSACSFGAPTPIVSEVGSLVKVQIDVGKETLENEWWRKSAAYEIYRAPDANYIPVGRTDEFSVRMTNVSGQPVVAILTINGPNSGVKLQSSEEGYVIQPGAFAQIFGRRTGPSSAEAFEWPASSHDSAYRWTYAPGLIKVEVFVGLPPISQTGDSTSQEASLQATRMNKQRREAEAIVEPYSRSRPSEKCAQPEVRSELRSSRVEVVTGPKKCTDESPSLLRTLQLEQAAAWQQLLLHGGGQFNSIDLTRFNRVSTKPAEVVEIRYDDWQKLQKNGHIRFEKGHPVRGPASLW